MKDNNHNHDASLSLLAHPVARRRSKEDKKEVIEMTKVNAPPSQIAGLMMACNKLMTRRDVSNIKLYERLKRLAGRTPIQALLEELQNDEEWIVHHEVDENGNITMLFFMYKPCRDLALQYGYVFVLDCTYQTNR